MYLLPGFTVFVLNSFSLSTHNLNLSLNPPSNNNYWHCHQCIKWFPCFECLPCVKICIQVISLSSSPQYCEVGIIKPIMKMMKWGLIEVQHVAYGHKANPQNRIEYQAVKTLHLDSTLPFTVLVAQNR